MKKYLAAFAVLFTVILSSCTNDDIPVGQTITFKVDPSTVISGYEEFYAGDLTSLGDYYRLRIRLLVYNESGNLVASEESYSDDYTHIQTYSLALPAGKYTSVAVTDVVGKTQSFEYYTLSGEDKLTTTTFTHTGYMGEQRNILGLTTESLTIDNSAKDFSIKVRPAGALIVYYIKNWNKCSDFNVDISTYELWANQSNAALTLDSKGEPEYSVKSSSDYDWRWLSFDHTEEYSIYQNVYGYVFQFPMTNVKLQWIGKITDTSRYVTWGDSAVCSLEAGSEYYFEIDIETDTAQWLLLNSRSESGNLEAAGSLDAAMAACVPDCMKSDVVTVRAIDYLNK